MNPAIVAVVRLAAAAAAIAIAAADAGVCVLCGHSRRTEDEHEQR